MMKTEIPLDQQNKRSFIINYAAYVLITPLLITINLKYVSQQYHWIYWPLIAWGIGLMFYFYSTLYDTQKELKKEEEVEPKRKVEEA